VEALLSYLLLAKRNKVVVFLKKVYQVRSVLKKTEGKKKQKEERARRIK